MVDLNHIAEDLRNILDVRRKEIDLSFIEDEHLYYMKDKDGNIKNDFPSVSKLLKKFYRPFDANAMSLKMSNGNKDKANKLMEEWKLAGDLSTNLGSRVHYELEKNLINRYGNYKKIRQPIFSINEQQKRISDKMIQGGEKFLDLMIERGAVLLDTEIVLGEPDEGYVGQPDKVWLIMNKDKSDYGFIITDYKSNKPKNFMVQPYTGKLYFPFEDYYDTALSHYYIQLSLYGRLLNAMLKNTKYDNLKLLGCIVVLLKDDGTFTEYRVPNDVTKTIYQLDLKKYI